jgi:hypothetical protein
MARQILLGGLFLAMAVTFAGASPPGTARPIPKRGSIDTALASGYFLRAKAISDKDGGRLWGIPLYGSTLFVDEITRDVVANRPDYMDALTADGTVFTGILPPEENVANTSTRWLGVTWTMLRWPLPEDHLERDVLFIHESFHRIQGQLGLDGPDASNDHLDTRDGRVWMELEWRALATALSQPKEGRKKALLDALVFRGYRRSLFKDAASHEQALEMHEGLPEYTGVALCANDPKEAKAYAVARLMGAPSMRTYVRSFAYATGPAYGLLLDDASPGWRRGLKAQDDLSDFLAKAVAAIPPPDPKATAESRAQAYGGKELMAAEDKRAEQKLKELASIRARFADGPVLIVPLTQAFSYSFDPTNQVPLEGLGTVYPYLRVSGGWGILEASGGALMVTKESTLVAVRVPAPKDPAARPLKGEGWTIDLKEGWAVVPGQREGDFELKGTSLGRP